MRRGFVIDTGMPRLLLLVLTFALGTSSLMADEDLPGFTWCIREGSPESRVREFRDVHWAAERTAFIVCDMWDYHHSVNAVRRLREFAPRLNGVLSEARARGAVIVHAPSDCMPFYKDHAARKRALALPRGEKIPDGMADWCHRIPEEEAAVYPIDQSNGGEDDDLQEHAQWAAYLESIGRNPGTPWKRQTDLLRVDEEKDYVASEGDVVWNILEAHRIDHVVLVGVHTNMCVLGRPFGLRQMERVGKDVVLMRDMTDIMYEPNSWPYVSHFTGIDLVIEHIERFVCPTVTSDQVVGGAPFQFAGDRRDRLALWVGEAVDENDLESFQWALQGDFRVVPVQGPGARLDEVAADVLLMHGNLGSEGEGQVEATLNAYRATGRPIIGPLEEGIPDRPDRPQRIEGASSNGVLLQGVADASTRAWTSVRSDGGRRFWSDQPRARINACYWSTDREVPKEIAVRRERPWRSVGVPGEVDGAVGDSTSWWRSLVMIPRAWEGVGLMLDPACFGGNAELYWNGKRLARGRVPAEIVQPNALNCLAVRLPSGASTASSSGAPVLSTGEDKRLVLDGSWRMREGDEAAWAAFPIPPQFGASTDEILGD